MKIFSGSVRSLLLCFGSMIWMTSGLASAQGSSAKAHFQRAIKAQIKLSEKTHDYQSVQKLKNLEPMILNSSEEDMSKNLEIVQKIQNLAESTEQLNNALLTSSSSILSPMISSSFLGVPFTQPEYSNICGSQRHSTDLMFAALNVYLIAEAVKEAALRGCQETIVVAGFGGNGSAVCLITDAVYVAAKVFHEELNFCQLDIERAEIVSTHRRAADNFNLTNEHHRVISNELRNHDNLVRSALSKHDLEIKNAVQKHDADMKNAVQSLDQGVTARLNILEAKLDKLQVSVDKNGKILEELVILINTPAGKRPNWPAK